MERRSDVRFDPESEIAICNSDGTSMLDALLATTDPGDEIVLTDPSYAGMINRVRLAGGVPRLVSCRVESGGWRLDLDHLRSVVGERTTALFLQNATFPPGWFSTRRSGELFAMSSGRTTCISSTGASWRVSCSTAGASSIRSPWKGSGNAR